VPRHSRVLSAPALAAAVLLSATAVLAACGGDGPRVLPQPLSVEVAGTLERGATVAVTVRDGDTVVDPAAVSYTATPPWAIEVVAPGQVRLLAAGTVEIRAQWTHRTGVRTVEVAEPEPLAVEVTGRIEEGEVVAVVVRHAGSAVDPAAVALSAAPADAVEVIAPGQIRLLAVGTVEIHAAWEHRAGSRTIEVSPRQPLTVEVSGTLERGATARVVVRDGGTELDPAAVALDAEPAGAMEIVAPGEVRWLATGGVEVRAVAAGRTGSVRVEVTEGVLSIEAEGRRERGGVLEVTVRHGGAALAPDSVDLTWAPADAAEALGDGRVRLLRAGTLELRAAAEHRAGTLQMTVAVPPTVVFDVFRDGRRDLWRVALDGQDLARLTDHAGEDLGASVAQGRVVFTSYRTGNAELFSVPAGGGAATRLTTTAAGETSVAVRPDGQRLAYASDATGVHKLWVANGDGTDRRAALPGFGFSGSIESSPSWAPAGNRLAFMSTAGGSADLWTVELDGGQPVLLAGGPGAYVDPAWSPDGEHVAFSSTRGGGPAQLYLVEVATGTVHRLTHSDGTDGEPAWTADGRLVYVAFDGAASELRWLDPAAPAVSHRIPAGAGAPRRPAVVR
jgi:Tol biopolymer transport system component